MQNINVDLSENEVENLIKVLDTVFQNDQKYRLKIQYVINKYGTDSKEARELNENIINQDFINLNKIVKILDKYGWLSPDIIGITGNKTLFLVIQHSDIETQKKYYTMMKDAVNRGNAQKCDLALLEDRMAIRQGQKQIYGSQIGYDEKEQEYYLQPLINPNEVDKRREEVGLNPISEYISFWGLTWNNEKYKILK